MKINRLLLRSFQTKVTLAFILSLFFLAGLGNLLLYKYSLNLQFSQIREKLMAIAKTSAVSVDADLLLKVPLNRQGTDSQEYKAIAQKLNKIKQANPSLKYIYTMAKTDQPGILQFIVDPDPIATKADPGGPTAFPGDKYEAWRFPEMLKAYDGPTVEKQLSADEWGVTLSGYAPIYDNAGRSVAILGVDININDVYAMQKAVRLRAVILLIIGIFISVILGILISRRVTRPVQKLVEGTRRIAAGDLKHKVEVEGRDEIAELAASFNNMAASLAESRKKLEDYFYRVVQTMVNSLEAKDAYTRGHSDRVSEYAYQIALEMGLPLERAQSLKKAAQLHDIGKLGINENILNKKTTLSLDEWNLIYKHPVVGEEILKPVFLDDELLKVIRWHHERQDGKGYPDELKGGQTNIFAQIVTVADAFDAMVSSRAYRPALSQEEAIVRLQKDCGTQFNPKVVEAFIKIINRKKA